MEESPQKKLVNVECENELIDAEKEMNTLVEDFIDQTKPTEDKITTLLTKKEDPTPSIELDVHKECDNQSASGKAPGGAVKTHKPKVRGPKIRMTSKLTITPKQSPPASMTPDHVHDAEKGGVAKYMLGFSIGWKVKKKRGWSQFSDPGHSRAAEYADQAAGNAFHAQVMADILNPINADEIEVCEIMLNMQYYHDIAETTKKMSKSRTKWRRKNSDDVAPAQAASLDQQTD